MPLRIRRAWNFSGVMPGTVPEMILGGTANARSGHFSNAPPATSSALPTTGSGGILWEPKAPIIAGTPLSNANHTCASCVSIGAKDMAMMSLFNKISTYSAACIKSGSDGSSGEGKELTHVINVGISATWKAGPTPWKSEAVTHHLNPILDRLLNAKLFMGNISKPSKISALRPFERDLVVGRRRDKAPEELLLGGAVPLPVFHHFPVKLPPPLPVLARRVLAVRHVARGKVHRLIGIVHR
nr:putative methyltransferase pmt16 [Ipomoea batatas]